MVVQDMKTIKIIICVDLIKLNDVYIKGPFPTLFTNEVLDSVGGQVAYSFMDVFAGYHQIKIAKEDMHKTKFSTEGGCYQYTIMPFGLKNAPAIFSKVVVPTFREFIKKLLEVDFDNWTVFGLLQKHV